MKFLWGNTKLNVNYEGTKNQQGGFFGGKGLSMKLERWMFRYVGWALSLLVDDPDSMIGRLRCFSGLECLSRAMGSALNLLEI